MTHELATQRTIAALRVAVRRDHRRRGRRRRTLVVALAAFALSGVAVAATETWWLDAPPATNPDVVNIQLAPTRYPDGRLERPADPARARTVARTAGAALVAAPTDGGGYCVLPQLPRDPAQSAIEAGLGFSCIERKVDDDGRGSVFATSTTAVKGTAGWLAYGRITDDGATHVDLSAAVGRPFRVPLRRAGFFIAALPEASWPRLDDRWDEIGVVGTDGEIIRRACVPFGPAPYSLVEGPHGGGGTASAERDARCSERGRRVQAPPRPLPALPAPEFAGRDALTGTEVSLRRFTGKPVVVAFWGAGREDVVYFLPGLARERLDGAVVAIKVGSDSIERAERERVAVGFPHLVDPERRLARRFGVTALPAMIFLDADHRVRSRIDGSPTESEVMRGLRMATSGAS